jgi:hypothetical protein
LLFQDHWLNGFPLKFIIWPSAKHIGLSIFCSFAVDNLEIKLQEYLSPSGLSPRQFFRGREEREVLMICFHNDGVLRSFQVDSPDFECYHYS